MPKLLVDAIPGPLRVHGHVVQVLRYFKHFFDMLVTQSLPSMASHQLSGLEDVL